MVNLETIKNKNQEINNKINQITDLYRANGKTIFDEQGNLDNDIMTILKYEMEKCVRIYLAEFPKYECKSLKDLNIEVTNKEGFELRGNENGIKINTGLQDFIDNVIKGEKAGIKWTEVDERVYATEILGQSLTPNIQEGSNFVDSTRDQADSFAEIKRKDKNDIDVILDVLPHEAMHIFIPGEGVIVEGSVERLTREIADKYGLRMSPTAHQRETEIISRLEKIVGREVISSVSLTNEQKSRRRNDNEKIQEQERKEVEDERYSKLKEALDEKMGEGTFDKLCDIFESTYSTFIKKDKNNFSKYRDSNYYDGVLDTLDRWIENNPDKIFEETSEDIPNLEEVFALQNEELAKLEEILQKNKGENNKQRQTSLQEIGEETLSSFSQNPGAAMKTMEILENGVRTQEKEGQTYGE